MRHWIPVATVLLLALPGSPRAQGQSQAEKQQILTTAMASAALADHYCGFRIDQEVVTRDMIYAGFQPEILQDGTAFRQELDRRVADLKGPHVSDQENACATDWRMFGTSGSVLRGILVRP